MPRLRPPTACLLLSVALALAAPAKASLSSGTADLVLGQGTFLTRGNNGFTNPYGLAPDYGNGYGEGVALDPASSRVYATDGDNHRVLFWNNPASLANGQDADGVLGEPDLVSTSSGVSASRLTNPDAVQVDASGNVWVVDNPANRVLRYPAPVTSGESADLVLGQADFVSSGTAVTASGLNWPLGVRLDASGNVWVVDAGNSRVLRYRPPFSNGQSADLVLGQTDFISSDAVASVDGLNNPSAVAFDASGDAWVADTTNNRVVEYPAPLSTGMAASLVLGQTDFSGTVTGTSSTTFSDYVDDLVFDGSGNLWVLDWDNNRELRFDAPFSTGMAASLVLGQADFTSKLASTTASLQNGPVGIAVDGSGNVWVEDQADNRLLRYPAPISSGESADLVLGQKSFTSSQVQGGGRSHMDSPSAVAVDRAHGRVFVADQNHHRVLVWNSLASLGTGSLPDAALGQPDLDGTGVLSESSTTIETPAGLAVDASGDLWVADANKDRVLRFPAPFHSGEGADVVLGQSDFTAVCGTHPSASCLGQTSQLAFDASGNLWVSGDARVVRFPAPFSTGESADLALGQADLASNAGGLAHLYNPQQLAFDSAGDLWVADTYNVRVLRFDVPLSTGEAPSLVLGQPNFASATKQATAAGMDNPIGVGVDAAGSVWVADTVNSRLLRFDVPLSSGMAAAAVVGQSVFTSTAGAVGAGGLNYPSSLQLDSNGNLWVSDTNNNRVLEFQSSGSGNIGAGGGTVSYVTSRGTVTVKVPAGAFDQAVSLTLSLPGSLPSGGGGASALTPTGDGIDVSVGGGVQPSRAVSLSVPYAAADVAGLDVSKLVLARYDPADNVWVPYPSTVDGLARLVTAQVNHFSTYQVMAAAAGASIGGGKVFPNPFRPALGHTSVTFANFPPGATLTVYTLLGEKVKDLTADANGLASWDGTTRFGEKAASGLYFVLAHSGASHAVYKVVVQR